MKTVRTRRGQRAARLMALVLVPLGMLGVAGAHVARAADNNDGAGHVTWLSGFGDDANPCSRTAPCKTLLGAFSKTAQPDGEIGAIDPGSYGNPSNNVLSPKIDGGIVVNGSPGFITMQTTVSGLDGLDIAAAPNDVVVLRHVDLEGFGFGLHGINFISGKALYIEDSVIEGFSGDGVHVAPSAGGQVFIERTTIRRNGGNGVNATGASPSAIATVSVTDSTIAGNAAAGVLAADYSDVTVDGSNVNGGAQGLACVTQSTGNCVITATGDTIGQNTVGVLSGRGVPGASGKATVSLSASTIRGNTKGLSRTATPSFGQIISFGDNVVVDNASPGKPTSTTGKI
jgi:parallel beta helix pectate lyase-like protein